MKPFNSFGYGLWDADFARAKIVRKRRAKKAYPDALRRVSYLDKETQKRLKFLTNNFVLPAFTIAQIYKCRWQVELFFKWIKQHCVQPDAGPFGRNHRQTGRSYSDGCSKVSPVIHPLPCQCF